MPTAPNANSPFMESRVAAETGGREPGAPSAAGRPGVQPADLSYPAPPAPATAPPGRPAAPAFPAPPTTPAKPATAAPTPTSATAPPSTAPGAAAALPPGTMSTPTTDPTTGTTREVMTPEGDARYRAAHVALREKLGPIPKSFRNPGLPEMPVELGKWNYNPFTGQFLK